MPEEMKSQEEVKIQPQKQPRLTQVELKSLVIISKFYERELKKMDVQNADYPYFKATMVDLYRLLGEEVLARNPEQTSEKPVDPSTKQE